MKKELNENVKKSLVIVVGGMCIINFTEDDIQDLIFEHETGTLITYDELVNLGNIVSYDDVCNMLVNKFDKPNGIVQVYKKEEIETVECIIMNIGDENSELSIYEKIDKLDSIYREFLSINWTAYMSDAPWEYISILREIYDIRGLKTPKDRYMLMYYMVKGIIDGSSYPDYFRVSITKNIKHLIDIIS